MAVMQRIVKPTTHKGKKALINKDPKLIENTKQCIFMKGKNTSDVVRNCLLDLYQLKKPDAVNLSKRNDVLPFENITPIEGFARKYNASLFAFASHSKKRPNNLILGRTYDDQLLDMVELGVVEYRGLTQFPVPKVAVGLKPCLLFAGDWAGELARVQNLLVDMLQRESVAAVRLQGLEHVIMCTAADGKIFLRSYRVDLKKSGSITPRVELEEIGPSIDFVLRVKKLASDDLFKLACKRPKALKKKKVKNIAQTTLGSTLGRIHMTPQNISKLQTRKMKGLKKTVAEKKKQKKKPESVSPMETESG